MNNEQINRAITEALGGCWHEWNMYVGDSRTPAHYLCIKCGTSCYRPAQDAPNIDYATDERACVKLWEEVGLFDVSLYSAEPGEPKSWVASKRLGSGILGDYVYGGHEPTFCLAVCKAFLKSKGIELENES